MDGDAVIDVRSVAGVRVRTTGNDPVMRLPLPGPADVIRTALALREGVSTAAGLVTRADAAMTRVEAMLDRLDEVLASAEHTAAEADDALARTTKSLDVMEVTARDAGRAVDGATGLLHRTDAMLGMWEQPLRRLAPAVQKVGESLDPREVQAAVSLIDRLPLMLDHVENDVLPMLRQLDRVGPDLHEVLEIVDDLRRVVTGLPGIGRLRRRGEAEPPQVEGSVHEAGA